MVIPKREFFDASLSTLEADYRNLVERRLRQAADWRLGVGLCLALIRGYQALFSQYFSGACRFLPSCAEYAAEAVERHGAFAGHGSPPRRLVALPPAVCRGPRPRPSPRGTSA